MDTATGGFVQYWTAECLIELALNNNWDVIVQTGPFTPIGKRLIKLAKQNNITLINITSDSSEIEKLQQCGAGYILNSTYHTFLEEFFNLAHKLRPKAFFDSIAGKLGSKIIQALPDSTPTYFHNGFKADKYQIPPEEFSDYKKTIKRFWLKDFISNQSHEFSEYLKSLVPQIWKLKEIEPVPESSYSNKSLIVRRFRLIEFDLAIEFVKMYNGLGVILLQP